MPHVVPSLAQPVICCVGRSVAGQPTQFLIERLTANQQLDWKALSVEVSPEQLETASNGMLAMGFKGLRLFGEYQSRAAELLAADDPAIEFVGSATSGAPSGPHWSLWDNVGFAWLELLRQRAAAQPYAVWLHGNSRTTRSTFAAIVELGAKAPNWIWTEAPAPTTPSSWPGEWTRWISEGVVGSEFSETMQNLVGKWLKVDEVPSDSDSEKETSTGVLGFVSEHRVLPVQFGDWLAQHPVELAVAKETVVPNSTSTSAVRRISSSDLAVAGEAYDFERWTGQKVDHPLLQDAYDEYCDF